VRRVAVLAGLVMLLLAGGALSSQLFGDAPIIVQSETPDASVFEATPQQAAQFIFWVGFVIVNLIGAGLTLAFFMWRGHAEVRRAGEMPLRETETAQDQADDAQLTEGKQTAGSASAA
jgi:hypothetical protein